VPPAREPVGRAAGVDPVLCLLAGARMVKLAGMSSAPGAAVAHDRNNFDFLRVAAAFAVLLSHQYALSGRPEPMVQFVGSSWGGLGVLVFFAISGYLVAGSWQQDPHLGRFAVRRLLRIWPGLAVACLLLALVLGPLVSDLGPGAYYRSPMLREYLELLGLWQFKAQLPGVFAHNPIPGSANGSLWTIPIEVGCYLALAGVGALGLLRRTGPALVVFAGVCIWFFFFFRVGYDQPIRMTLQMGIVFFAGACCWLLRPWWQPRRLVVGAVAAALVLAAWHGGWHEAAFTLGLPVAVVAAGTASTPVLRSFGRYGDVSYGLYIFAYPVQQTVIALGQNNLSVAAGAAWATAVTLLLAFLSWHLVEKRALALKSRLAPRRAAQLPEAAGATPN
jgi:peptidoglycan/LPS O-acetylase OafA/YrhL